MPDKGAERRIAFSCDRAQNCDERAFSRTLPTRRAWQCRRANDKSNELPPPHLTTSWAAGFDDNTPEVRECCAATRISGARISRRGGTATRSDGMLRVPRDAGCALRPRVPPAGHRGSDLASLRRAPEYVPEDRKSTRLNSSHVRI